MGFRTVKRARAVSDPGHGVSVATQTGIVGVEEVLLHCPVRGPLGATALAKDQLTPTEEARRVDFLHFLVEDRCYPAECIRVEVVTIKNLGEGGRNQLRADVIAYDTPWLEIADKDLAEQLEHAILVAEIKRDATKKAKGVTYQLEPALRVLPRLDTVGVYWDDDNRILFTKAVNKRPRHDEIVVRQDSIANLPDYGVAYRVKAITVDTLTKPANFVATLQSVANVMRSHGVNDEHQRYKETVKLLLARYIDEKKAASSSSKQLKLQVLEGDDNGFMARVRATYTNAAIRYSKVQTLFHPRTEPDLDEATLRDLVKLIQGFDFSSASSDTMQQVFMTFVPAVFKKDLSQYFTPTSLIDTMVQMVAPGATDKIADPAMGTADFLTAAMNYCALRGDTDVHGRVFGMDSDPKAFDLAVVNMILNHDGQANLLREDSIEKHRIWQGEIDVVFCNPPFGANTVERRPDVLKEYDLGHEWEPGSRPGTWTKTRRILAAQQAGILFIERCWKMLVEGGRLAIILPEGYLSTPSHGYVRRWMLENFVIRSLVELPRRIFVKSDVDLRSNILIAEKRQKGQVIRPYPIHASMVRRVGYKLGGDFKPLPLRSRATGIPVRGDDNKIVLDSDFHRVLKEYASTPRKVSAAWTGATVTDILNHADLDMKPRRLVPRALNNIRALRSANAVVLREIADVVEETIDLLEDVGASKFRRVVEGQDIRAIEGIVVPHPPERCWSIAERKQRRVYELREGDVIVGLVRPERRNVGVLLDSDNDVVGSTDGLAVVRIKKSLLAEYPQEWLLSVLRSEDVRLQFWTESGGTSYGKLDNERIARVLIPVGTRDARLATANRVRKWIASVKDYAAAWSEIGGEGDRRAILNSPLTGLFDEDDEYGMDLAGTGLIGEGAEGGADSDKEEQRDAEIARAQIAKMKADPKELVGGRELEEALDEMLR